MCRNIKVLYNFDPPATKEEIHDASLQYVRKISGYREPSSINEAAFEEAVRAISQASSKLVHSLKTDAKPKSREAEAAKAKARAAQRFGG